MNSTAALKCNGYGFKSSLAGHIDKGSEHCIGAQYVNVQESVRCGGCKFFLVCH